MSEAEPNSGGNDPSVAEPRGPAYDFSAVQGFQLVGAEDQGGGDDPGWRDALRLEFEARAARFHQAVDSAIVLSNDGVIRWLGDPVARLSAGADALNPSALMLADPSLPDASRDTIRTRVELWIAATTRRILAPLFALESLQEGPESVRHLAHRLARSLGILEREPIRAEINALSQTDRAELRKLGVRFGAYYLFVPALIKPAARTLALQLWSLQAPGDAGELLRALAPIAASGRTSLALETGISHEGYRVAGYRPCGERVVRVDIIERLGGMIRAAIVGEQPGVAPEGPPEGRPASRGFVVNGQMTSLTGCSGEPFASILRSMRFRPVEMKRSEFFGAPAGQSREQPAPLAPTQAQTPTGDDPPPAQETSEEAAAIEPVAVSAEAPPDAGEPLVNDAPSPGSADLSGPEANSAEEGVSPGASGPSDAGTSDAGMSGDETIVVWRPDHHRTRPSRRETRSRPPSGNATPRRSDDVGQGPVRSAGRGRLKKRRPDAGEGGRAPASADRPGPGADEKHRQRASDRDMRSNPPAAAQPRATVDPNSPFAKLLELRSLLEGQANKRP